MITSDLLVGLYSLIYFSIDFDFCCCNYCSLEIFVFGEADFVLVDLVVWEEFWKVIESMNKIDDDDVGAKAIESTLSEKYSDRLLDLVCHLRSLLVLAVDSDILLRADHEEGGRCALEVVLLLSERAVVTLRRLVGEGQC